MEITALCVKPTRRSPKGGRHWGSRKGALVRPSSLQRQRATPHGQTMRSSVLPKQSQAMVGPKGPEPRREAFSRIMQSPVANAKESTGTLAVKAQTMDFRERKLYHQIHPLK